ncbi:MAG TPA: nucleotide exchange factor GrpE [Candidatus Eremiobacteraceae bacterium]|nr:nucleotide exchange factor GrpE [Candidatus Eremiobacteraceae bacterium]
MADLNPLDEYDSLSGSPLSGIDDAGTADGAADGAAAVQSELAAAKAQAEENRNLYLRTLADFDNYKKRVDRTIVERSGAGRRDLLKRMLDVLDSLDRADAFRRQDTTPEQLVEGVLATAKQFATILDNENVTPIDVVGKPFDPAVAEAVGTRPNPDVPEHTVLDEARKGYRIGDEVLRPAQVIVSVGE